MPLESVVHGSLRKKVNKAGFALMSTAHARVSVCQCVSVREDEDEDEDEERNSDIFSGQL